MSIYNTAYNTTACSGIRMQKAIDAIQEARLRDYMPAADSVLMVESTHGASSVIPQFNHPLYIGKHEINVLQSSPDAQLEAFLAVDLRPTGRFDTMKGEFKVTNSTVHKSRLVRAGLNAIWLSQGPNAIRNVTPMAMGVFANWISDTVGFRYGLDPKTRYDLTIMAAIFYASNHTEGEEFDKAQEGRHLAGIANALKYNLDDVVTIYSQTKLIHSIDDFCKKAVTVLNNVRLTDFNMGVFAAIMYTTWFGDNAKENVLVALEHPPTWLALLFEAFTNTMMKKTPIARICERRLYKDGLETLVRTIRNLTPEAFKA